MSMNIFCMIDLLQKLSYTLMLSNTLICVTGLSTADSTQLLSMKDVLCIKKFLRLFNKYIFCSGFQFFHDSSKSCSSSYSVQLSPTHIHNFQVHRVATVLRTECSCEVPRIVDSCASTVGGCGHVFHVRCAWHIKQRMLMSKISIS